jgi:coenzyme PQQ precursor peptide PqqA
MAEMVRFGEGFEVAELPERDHGAIRYAYTPIRKYDWKLSYPETILEGLGGRNRVRKVHRQHPAKLGLKLAEGEPNMREWHKPTIEETESGMEVTSYLPAELDRA